MRFDRESWRKLYVAESVQHRMLPLFTRGLRDYLLRHAEDDGTILRDSVDHAGDLARLAVVEREKVGREASWAAAGMLAPDLECEEADDFHRFCRSSLSLYPRFAGELLDETGIDIELDRTGTMYLAFDVAEAAAAAERYARQRVTGIAVETMSTDGVLKIEPLVSSSVKFGLLYPNNWQVENRKLVAALERFCRDSGVEIVDNCCVEGVAVESGRVTGVRTASGVVSAGRVVVAAGAWSAMVDIGGPSLPVRPIRGQMIAYARLNNITPPWSR
jgi:glycine oxidase